MHLTILSAGTGWHVQDLMRAARLQGHLAQPLDFRRLAAPTDGGPIVAGSFDAVMVRTMPPGSLEQVVFRMDVLHRWQSAGARVLNPPSAIETCVDKYVATAKLAAAGLTVPPTITCQHADAALEAYAQLGGDVVIKPLFGSEGRGMVRVADPEMAWRAVRSLERLNAVIYLQKYIAHEGHDLRAFVVGDQVVAAMRRWARGDWRTNVAQGGRAEPVELTSAETMLALKAARAVGAPVCGVDLLPGRDGRLYVLEVNSVPGWRALSPTSGIDIAALLIHYLANEYGR